MKVYITHYKDGFGDQEIDKIFLSSEKACKYVIEGQGQFQHNDYYKKFTEVELMEQALHFVLESDVEE
jgi:hypothetical protein